MCLLAGAMVLLGAAAHHIDCKACRVFPGPHASVPPAERMPYPLASLPLLLFLGRHRNLTITGLDPAAVLAPPPPPTLDDLPVVDWGYRQGGLVLCATCTLTLAHLALEGERRGAGPLLDPVRADPGGVVVLQDALRLRSACNPYQGSLNYTSNTPRPPGYPGQQTAALVDVWYRGQAYPNALQFGDVVQGAPAVAQEGSPTRFGYILVGAGGKGTGAGAKATTSRGGAWLHNAPHSSLTHWQCWAVASSCMAAVQLGILGSNRGSAAEGVL